jgi:hypothetical protein
METASRRVAVNPYKNHCGPGWVVAHELDEAGKFLCVFIRLEPGGPAASGGWVSQTALRDGGVLLVPAPTPPGY